MNRVLGVAIRWLAAPVLAALSYVYAPPVSAKHPPSELGTFFATSATVLGAFFIALALLVVASPLGNLRMRRTIGNISFFYLAIGSVAAVAGTLVDWQFWLYRCLLAAAVGSGAAIVIAITRVGIANLRTQRDEIHATLAQVLGRSPDQGAGSGLAAQLAALAELFDRGLLSKDELERVKSKILS